MNREMWVLFFVLCVLAAAGFIWLGVWMVQHGKEQAVARAAIREERERGLAEKAARYGWKIEPAVDTQLKNRFPHAVRHDASAVFTGQWREWEFGVFQYTYQIQSLSSSPSAAFGDGGNDTYADPHWAVVVATPAQLPEMNLQKNTRTLSDSVTFLKRFEKPPAPLVDPAFDQQFMVIAQDRSAVPTVFAPNVRQLVLADTRFSDWGVGFVGSNIYSEADGGVTVDRMELIAPKLDMLCDFLERVPQAAWSQSPQK